VPEVDACSSLPKQERGNEDWALLRVVLCGRLVGSGSDASFLAGAVARRSMLTERVGVRRE
jgi:hypothetical protein